MTIFYSAQTRGFYDNTIHKTMPVDAVEITPQERADVLAGERQGKVITADTNGRPTLIEPVTTLEELANRERAWRDGEIQLVSWLRERHRDEQDQHLTTTLTTEEFTELLTYLQLLRDWPQSPQFPDQAYRPIKPTWIENQQSA